MKIKGISIVVPFLNEEDIIKDFCDAIDKYQNTFSVPLEIVFVDDGSTDNTVSRICQHDFMYIKKVKIIELSKNYGSHLAIRAGLQNVSNNIVTWMGSDLQDPLELLCLGKEKIEQGYDAVYFAKKTVKVSWREKMFSTIYAGLMKKYAVRSFETGGINTIMINDKILKVLNDNVESNSSIILQILNCGFKYTTINLNYNERKGGKSKWTLSKKIKLFIDSFVSFSFMPIRLVSITGVFIFALGFAIGTITIINKFVNPDIPVGYSTLASILALGFGITNIALGIIAEYLWRTYDAARKRPAFIISDIKEVMSEE